MDCAAEIWAAVGPALHLTPSATENLISGVVGLSAITVAAVQNYRAGVLFFYSRRYQRRLPREPRQCRPFAHVRFNGKRGARTNRRNQKEFHGSSCGYNTGNDRYEPPARRGIAITTFDGRRGPPRAQTQKTAARIAEGLDSHWGTLPQKTNPPKPGGNDLHRFNLPDPGHDAICSGVRSNFKKENFNRGRRPKSCFAAIRQHTSYFPGFTDTPADPSTTYSAIRYAGAIHFCHPMDARNSAPLPRNIRRVASILSSLRPRWNRASQACHKITKKRPGLPLTSTGDLRATCAIVSHTH